MSPDVKEALAAIGIGLLFGWLGLILVADIFGVADEHAAGMARQSRRWPGLYGPPQSTEQVKRSFAFLLGRYLAGGGFILAGLAIITAGVVSLVR
jgi:hypothetical protein